MLLLNFIYKSKEQVNFFFKYKSFKFKTLWV